MMKFFDILEHKHNSIALQTIQSVLKYHGLFLKKVFNLLNAIPKQLNLNPRTLSHGSRVRIDDFLIWFPFFKHSLKCTLSVFYLLIMLQKQWIKLDNLSDRIRHNPLIKIIKGRYISFCEASKVRKKRLLYTKIFL